MRTPKGVARGALGNSTNKDVAKKPTAVKAVKKMGSGTSGCGGASATPVVILPQRPPKYGSSHGGQSSSKKGGIFSGPILKKSEWKKVWHQRVMRVVPAHLNAKAPLVWFR